MTVARRMFSAMHRTANVIRAMAATIIQVLPIRPQRHGQRKEMGDQ